MSKKIPAAHHDDESAHGIYALSCNISVGC